MNTGELVLRKRGRVGAYMAAGFIADLGVLLIVAGWLLEDPGTDPGAGSGMSSATLLLITASAVFVLALFVLVFALLRPDRVVLTPLGVRIDHGKASFLIPAAGIRAFTVVPLMRFRGIDLLYDPAQVPEPPGFVARYGQGLDPYAGADPRGAAGLGARPSPGRLRLAFVGRSRAAVRPARVAQIRDFVVGHGLGEWIDQEQAI